MQTIPIFLLFAAGIATTAVAQDRTLKPEDLPLRQGAAATLQRALATERTAATTDAATAFAALRATSAMAAANLPDGSTAKARLGAAIDAAVRQQGYATATAALRRAIAELADDLTFTPAREAALPQGFPGYRAVDEIELREYPAYRMVKAPMRRGGASGSFWMLFQHIQGHGIAMTTPVQVDYDASGERPREQSMAFLYGDPTIGTAGVDGRVEVVDVPDTKVLSLGARGYERQDRVDAMRLRLEQWLGHHAHEFEAAGPMRLMNYNSPMVGEDRRYFEVQLPVRAVRPTVVQAASR